MQSKELAVTKKETENIQVIFDLPPTERVKRKIAEIEAFQALVRQYLKPGLDYGIIPGTGKKPTLLKPGAEKVDKLLDLSDNYEIIEKTEDWNKPFFNYLIRCELRLIGSNILVSSGMGSCNSMESKYRYRWLWPSDVPEHKRAGMVTRTINVKGRRQVQFRVDNDDICSQVNTILKMAKKRAHIDATLSAARLSELFTQDIEDLVPEETLNTDEETVETSSNAPQSTQVANPVASEPKQAVTDTPDKLHEAMATGQPIVAPVPSKVPATTVNTPQSPGDAPTAGKQKWFDPALIKTPGDLFQACWINFKVMKQAALDELNVKSAMDIRDVQEAYQKIAAVRQK